MSERQTRRGFMRIAAAGSAAMTWLGVNAASAGFSADKPALLGGTPAHSGGWPKWPIWNQSWEPEILKILRSGLWYRGGDSGRVQDFERAYADLLGAKRCLATASGTTSLITALHVAGVDAGDEVIVSPYTFNATYNAILMNKALPVFADTDPATWNMDPASIESRITDRTRAILPVHIYGMPCDMDPINAIARKHELSVVEDACQAWMGEYKGRKCGTLGDLGCFSFQNSKHIPSGEGGAITSDNDELVDRCTAFHNCGRATGSFQGRGCFTRGSNFRMQHFQGAILLQQIDKLIRETKARQDNADYLTAQLTEVPGLTPSRLPENSKAAWHLFPMRYESEKFNGLPRTGFLRALRAEGIPCSTGYSEQYFDGIFDETVSSRGYQRLFGAKRLKEYLDSFHELKGNRQTCESTVAIFQSLLLADRKAMDHIIAAVHKIQSHSAELKDKV